MDGILRRIWKVHKSGGLLQVAYVNQKKSIKHEQALWLVWTTGKNIPAGTAEMERIKQCSDTEKAEQTGKAVDWKGRTKQEDTLGIDDLFLSQSKLNLLDYIFWTFKLNIHFAHFDFSSHWVMPVFN